MTMVSFQCLIFFEHDMQLPAIIHPVDAVGKMSDDKDASAIFPIEIGISPWIRELRGIKPVTLVDDIQMKIVTEAPSNRYGFMWILVISVLPGIQQGFFDDHAQPG
jgi:hypothetical protein